MATLERQYSTGGDLEATVKSLSDRNDASMLNIMLKQQEYPQAVLNAACQTAMQLEKINFVALLLRHGATPSPAELVYEMIRFCEHPTIQQYFCGWSKENWTADDPDLKLTSMEWHYDYSKEKEVIGALIEEAEKHSENKKHARALIIFLKAINVCRTYHLDAEYSSIVENSIFCNSILHGIKRDKTRIISSCRNLSSDFSSRMLIEILARSESKKAHLEFLIGEVWKDKSLDISASKVSMKQLIGQKSIRDERFIEICLKLGMPLTTEDIAVAIRELPTKEQQLFMLLTSKLEYSQEDLDSLCKEAINAGKIPFVITFLQLGASLPSTKIYVTAIKDALKTVLEQKDFDGARALIRKFTEGITKHLDLVSLMESNIVNYPELIKLLLEKGINPNSRGKKTPIGVVMSNECLKWPQRIEIVCLLLKNGEDCRHLSLLSESATTPLYVATEIALREREGGIQLIDAVFDSSTFDLDTEILNTKKQTPLHLAVRIPWKKDVSTKVLVALLKRNLIDPNITDQDGKRPIDYLSNCEDDDRHNLLEGAMEMQSKKYSSPFPGYESLPSDEKLDYLVNIILEKIPQIEPSAEQQCVEYELINLGSDDVHSHQCAPEYEDQTDVADVKVKEKDDFKQKITEVSDRFDTLLWEVEVTPKVVDFFKNTKRNSITNRLEAARTICKLAEGMRNKRLSKRVVSNEKSLNLFEARMNQGSRILWEEAISYSAKLSSQTNQVYSQVIRVWEIVLSHDDLDRRIRYCKDQIEKSHRRGSEASSNFKWFLMPQKQISCGEIAIPDRFTPITEKDRAQSEHRFIPAASTRDDQYNVSIFHSFDASTIKSLLLGANDRMEFPFKEWRKENEIVKLNTKEAILVLGRSGTGKTTCCLYRLWNEFNGFWNPTLNTTYKIPRECLTPSSIVKHQEQVVTELDDSNLTEVSQLERSKELLCSDDNNIAGSDTVRCTSPVTGSIDHKADIEKENVGELTASCLSHKSKMEENLHQIFITKNRVLCDYMKKSFYNMAAAHEYDFLKSHMRYENAVLPNSLSQICDEAFPLFLTARQFFILLDNSLGDTSTCFPRDKDGNITIKITSTDYDDDYRKIVLRLRESNAASSPTKAKQWVEVTALYFKDHIWRNISGQHARKGKEFEPMLVWTEIQSFIKGSESALRKGKPLSREEYKILGDHMAPSYADHRDAIYDIFKKYQDYRQGRRHSVILYDECDLILHIYNRLNNIDVKDVPWSIHSLYIDEVQDFTQAELAVLVQCTCDINSVFFTGDTAQTISRGISFRFQDIRSLFHHIAESKPKIKVPQLHNLTLNFRSHSGILRLAGSIIDVITEFFTHSIDDLPNDDSMLPGPTPVIVESCKVSDLALLLRANKREVSTIEFGSHQVILVQSQQARKNLPCIFKNALVFTIFEAKGLEFDDVLLYNFFSDSMIDEKGWRVVSSYLEKPQHHTKVINGTSIWDTRSCQFNPSLNKSLNDELKRLYTAITRAKSNLWIYDSNQKLRLPMFDYWYKRNLVKVVQTGKNENIFDVVFAANSAPEQWKAQGDNLMEKGHFEQAFHCYKRAGKDYEHLIKKADAYCLLQHALNLRADSKEDLKLWLKVAIKFLETAEYCVRSDSLECVSSFELLYSAAICLGTSQPPRFSLAAQLFEHAGKEEDASQMYLKAGDVENYARMKEKLGQHNEVIQTLWNKPFLRRRDALAKAKTYEETNVPLQSKWSVSTLSYSCVKFYSERKDTRTLIEVLQYIPQVNKQVKFLKDAKLYAEAYNTLVKHEHFKEACTLASAQGGCTDITSITSSKSWLNKGLEIATQINNEVLRASFVFQMAELDLKFGEKASADLIKELESLISSKSCHIKAQAHLLFGMLKKRASDLNSAQQFYHDAKHNIGELEAFNQLQQFDNTCKFTTDQLLLNACHLSVETSQALKDATFVCKELKDAINFYGMDWTGSYYLMPPGQNIWIKDLLMKCVCKVSEVDVDGMVMLDNAKVKNELINHCKMLKLTWLACHRLQKRLEEKLTSFTLHEQLWKYNLLNCTCPDSKLCTENMQRYLQTSVQMLELQCLNDHSGNQLNIEQNIAMLVAIFTPRVNIFVQKPHQFTAEHVSVIRQSVNSQKFFQQYISESIINPTVQHADVFQLEPWIMAWRACCISDPDMKGLFDILQNLEKFENNASSCTADTKSETSPKFIFWRSNQQYYHIFSIWLNSCAEIRENEKPLWAARLAIKHFLGNIDAKHNISSTLDVVYFLSVHCTSLLAILTHVNALNGYNANYTVPLSYEKLVNLFDLMNTWKPEHHFLLLACRNNVRRRKNHSKILDDCYRLLAESLQILLGTRNTQGYLELNLKCSPSENGTRHCLILVLVLLGNVKIYPVLRHNQIKYFTEKLKSLIRGCVDTETEVPNFILEVKNAIKAHDNISKPSNIFTLVTKLLDDAKVDSTLGVLAIHPQSDRVKIEPVCSTPTEASQSESSQSESSTLQLSELTNSQHGTQSQPMPEGSSSLPQRIPPQSQLSQMTYHDPVWNMPAHNAVHLTSPQTNYAVPLWPNIVLPQMVPPHPFVWPRAQNLMPPQSYSHSATFNPMQPQYSSGYPVLQPPQHNQLPPSNRKYTESDDVEEEVIKLTAGVSSEPSIDPNVIDPERIIVTDKYCNACGINLVNTELPGVSPTSAESQTQDYYVHLMSPGHRESFTQFTIFSSKKEEKRKYKQLVQELINLKDKCQEAKQVYDTHEFDQVIDDIQEKMDESVKTISSHEKDRSWKEGSEAISRWEESLGSLLQNYGELYTNVLQDLKARHQDEQIMNSEDVLTQDLEELERLTEKHDPMLD